MDKIRDGSFNANSYLSVLLVVDVVIVGRVFEFGKL